MPAPPQTSDNVREILDYIDEQARDHGWRNQNVRSSTRKRLRAPCEVRYFALDNATVLTLQGKTRDISRNGVGLIASAPLANGAGVYLHLTLPDGKKHILSGVVTFSRKIRGDWSLTGVQFGRSVDRRLAPPTNEKNASKSVQTSNDP
jgi:hypothetical protein